MFSLGAKPVRVAVVVAGNGGPKTLRSSDRFMGPVMAAPLRLLSAPRQYVPITGVTVYVQCPFGMPCSMHVFAMTTPAQPGRVVCLASVSRS